MIKNCGLYIRVSTDLQASEIEGSLKTQQQRLEEEIARRSSREVRWTASRVYIEKGKSGKDTNRPEFQRMLRDIEAGIINTVACTELSRLSRSVSDFLHFVDFLKLHNCDFICLKQQFDTTTAHGKMFLTLVMALAEFERELTSERTRAHMLARKERGLWNGGRIDGYDLDPARKGYLVVNETEAELIRFIFRMYLETQSCTRTRDIVNQKGYRTKSYTARRGAFHPPREFDKNKIFKILKSPVYIGKIEANKRNKGKEDVPEAERYRLVDGVHQGIVPEAIFHRAQEIMEKNNRTGHSAAVPRKHDYLLAGIIRCRECGSAMTPKSARGRNRRYFYYECTAINGHGRSACTVRSVSAPEIEELVLARIADVARSDRLCEALIAKTNKELAGQGAPLKRRRQALQRKIAGIESEAGALVRKLAQTDDQPSGFILEALQKLETERESLRKELTEAEAALAESEDKTVDPAIVRQGLEQFHLVFDELKIAEKKRLMELLLQEVTYAPDQIKMALYELPRIGPETVNSARFAESITWLKNNLPYAKTNHAISSSAWPGNRSLFL